MDKTRVLLTYMESGMGHITSMKSISDALKNMNLPNLELIDCYIMQEDNDPVLIKFNNFIIHQTKQTNCIRGYGPFVFWWLEVLGKQKFMVFVHHLLFRKALNHTLEAFKKRNPDVIVSTHYFTTLAAVEYKRRVNKNCIVITYNPDNNVHPWWDNRDGMFVVNNDVCFNEAIKRRHFKAENVKQVYFTARNEVINAAISPNEYRKKYNIPQDKFCVMIADGAYASARSVAVAEELLKTDLPLTIIMLAGKNEEVYNKFKALESKTKPNITLITSGFTTSVHELYCASDLFVTKAGPNAILDSVFMGTPIIVDFYAHPIEKATTKLFVDDYNVGKAIYKPKQIRAQIEEFIKDPNLLAPYKENCKKFDKSKNGSLDMAKIIVDEINKHNSNAS